MSANREASGYLPKHVTLVVMGDIKLSELEYALAGRFEVYVDVRENLCLRTVEAGKAHRALVFAERKARVEHARRHAEIVRKEGERNVANNFRAPEYRRIDCGNEEPPELRAMPEETDECGLPL